MTTTIPDLWSDDIKVDILTPLAILRTQVTFLERKTQGVLRADVFTTEADDWVQHQLDLIAPALHQYRTTLLTARHHRDRVYPVTIQAECFFPKREFTTVSVRTATETPPDQREASTQEQFIELVRQVLQSEHVRSIIQSLIARSNEARTGESDGGGSGPENS